MTHFSPGFIKGAAVGGDASITFTWDPENDEALPGGSSFTRASVAEEFDGTDFTQVSSGTIREDSAAVAAGAQGYLPEPAATNQLLQSSDLTDAAWTKFSLTASDNGINALGLNESEIDAGTGTAVHRIFASASAGGNGSGYFICKQGTGRYITVQRGGSSANYGAFDLQDGTVSEVGGTANALITSLGDGWYKCEVNLANANTTLSLVISNSGTPGTAQPSFTGANETILVCHAQYETTALSTSPNITAGSTLSRVAEVLDTGVAITTTFSALLDVTLPLVIASGDTISLLGPDATAEDILSVNTSFNVIMDDGGTPVTIGTSSAGARIKVAYGRNAGDRSASLDGATAVDGGAPGAGHEGDNFQLGCANSVNQSRCIHHLTTLYDEKKSDAELETLAS